MKHLVKHGTLPVKIKDVYKIVSRLTHQPEATTQDNQLVRDDLAFGVNYDLIGCVLPWTLEPTNKPQLVNWDSEGKRAAKHTKGIPVVLVSLDGTLRVSFSRNDVTKSKLIIQGVTVPVGTNYTFLYEHLRYPDDWLYCCVKSFSVKTSTNVSLQFRPSPGVPQTSNVKVKSTTNIRFLRDYLAKETGETVIFIYVHDFLPRDDETVGDLYYLYGSFGSLSLTYSKSLLYN